MQVNFNILILYYSIFFKIIFIIILGVTYKGDILTNVDNCWICEGW